ncbi:MAG: hypothetical protein NTY22_08975 [Proteobacteria bacterium]|nr:hypothetical protein [Pseudomonadota bacterium]
MKKLVGFAAVLVALFLSNNIFSNDLIFEYNGRKYEVTKQDLYERYNFNGAKAACAGLLTTDDKEGKTGWVVPSDEVLNAMYEQLYKKNLGGFADHVYWSSSKKPYNNDGREYPRVQDFRSGVPGYGSNESYWSVRCVRVP